MSRYRKRPIEVEAHRWDGTFEVAMEIIEWMRQEGGTAYYRGPRIQRELVIDTLEGRVFASPGDWVIQGVAGEFYPCKAPIFEITYEPVADENEEGAP